MITRAFLLLLAMLTGLTAAQAGEVAQVGHGVAGWSASNADIATVEAPLAQSVLVFGVQPTRHIVRVQAEHRQVLVLTFAGPVTPKTVSKSDRMRI